MEPTDDEEKNARMKKRIKDQLAKLKRNAERRRQRQLTKLAGLAEIPVLGLIRGKREGAMVKKEGFFVCLCLSFLTCFFVSVVVVTVDN